jgi:hypothetical protein
VETLSLGSRLLAAAHTQAWAVAKPMVSGSLAYLAVSGLIGLQPLETTGQLCQTVRMLRKSHELGGS